MQNFLVQAITESKISLSFSIDVGHPPPSTEFQHNEKPDSYQDDVAGKVVRKRLDDNVQELDAGVNLL